MSETDTNLVEVKPESENLTDAIVSRGIKIVDEYATALMFGMFLSGYIIFYVLKIPEKIDTCVKLLEDVLDEVERLKDTIGRK
jgi:hypothetical protein